MANLNAFNFITLNGYFEGAYKGDISWHRHGTEENEFAVEAQKPGGILLFGRVTYDQMAGYWPSPDASRHSPALAASMNKAEKIVFSRTMKKAEWNNTKIVGSMNEIRKLKETSTKDMTLLGSGSILTQLAEEGLLDSYQVMLDPVILGDGSPIFKGLTHKLDLQLMSTRTFKSGVVLLTYQILGK
jgi:dihydrofolate reductase